MYCLFYIVQLQKLWKVHDLLLNLSVFQKKWSHKASPKQNEQSLRFADTSQT